MPLTTHAPTPLTVGMPRPHKEKNERRDFLPAMVEFIGRLGSPHIAIEDGYGSGMGIEPKEYLAAAQTARLASYDECLAQDVVVVLRCPDDAGLRRIRKGALLVSMLHLDTRPGRVDLLRELGLKGVSLDLVRDDLGRRMVENLEAVAVNGVREACKQLRLQMPGFASVDRGPLRVTILGAGAVGAHAVRAAARYGDDALRQALAAARVPGVEVLVVDHELSADEPYMHQRLRITDLLVDATRRPDASRVIVPNRWLAELPAHAVVLDLSVDPFDFGMSPPHVKAIEGVPQGDLDKFCFPADDPAFELLDQRIPHAARRTVLSCYSWPGVDPRACMEVYSKQVEPVMRAVLQVGIDVLDPTRGPWFERATARASLSRWRGLS